MCEVHPIIITLFVIISFYLIRSIEENTPSMAPILLRTLLKIIKGIHVRYDIAGLPYTLGPTIYACCVHGSGLSKLHKNGMVNDL